MLAAAVILLPCCEEIDDAPQKYLGQNVPGLPLDEVAMILSAVPMEREQVQEVYDAVNSSSSNGYDEEYMMRDLFREPGSGVGDERLGTKTTKSYATPLKSLIEDRVHSLYSSPVRGTRSGGRNGMSAEEYLAALQNSDIQIYWPYAEEWDGTCLPVITFDPADGSSSNYGYCLERAGDGELRVEEIVVDEALAKERPVWVVNRNDDSGYDSIEMLRRGDPDWGNGGGGIVIRPSGADSQADILCSKSPGGETSVKTLILKDFTMRRNYDPWFAGASEFFVKIGAVENFTASTEAELKVYSPTITDFMVVVKRKDAGKVVPFNAVLVSEWTKQLENIAFMIIEDDGGTRTTWKTSAIVKVNSKSYGFDISLPINARDDIVWRGQLSRNFIMAYDGVAGHFGDVDLTFEIVEHGK